MFIHFPHGFTIFPMFFPSFLHLPDKLHLAAVLRADTSPSAWRPAASRSKHHSRRRPCGSANRCLSLATGGEEWKVVPSGNRIPSGYVKIAIENGHWNSGFTHWKWWFSIVMLVYQRVILVHHGDFMVNQWWIKQQEWWFHKAKLVIFHGEFSATKRRIFHGDLLGLNGKFNGFSNKNGMSTIRFLRRRGDFTNMFRQI